MMGEWSPQGNLFSGDRLHLDPVGRESCYGWLATEGPRVFPDVEFKGFYVLDNGRKSVPPSQMMRMVLLQWFDKVSDDQAIERAKFDLRWKVALGLEDHAGLCAKFTLQTFRGKPLLSDKGRDLLKRSVKVCRETGTLRSRKIRAAMDTSPIIGRGAVKDTYNLVADGMVKLRRALAAFETPLLQPVDVERFARATKAGNAHDADGSPEAIERAEQTLEAAWEQVPVEEAAWEQAPVEEAAAHEEADEESAKHEDTNGEAAKHKDVNEDHQARPRGRTVSEHPEERLLAQARATAEPRVSRGLPATANRRTPAGAHDATGCAPSALLRPSQNRTPMAHRSHRGQPHPGH